MTTIASDSLAGSLDTALAGSALNGLTSGSSTAAGTAINNTPTNGSTVGYPIGDLTIRLSSAVTTGAGSPFLTVYLLPSVDGTNYQDGTPVWAGYSFQYPPSTSLQTLVCPDLPLPPYNFKVVLANTLGVTLPATNTSTCQLQRRTLATW